SARSFASSVSAQARTVHGGPFTTACFLSASANAIESPLHGLPDPSGPELPHEMVDHRHQGWGCVAAHHREEGHAVVGAVPLKPQQVRDLVQHGVAGLPRIHTSPLDRWTSWVTIPHHPESLRSLP